MTTPRVARRYAAALMDVAETPKQLAAIGDDLDRIDEVLRASRDLLLVLHSPVVSPGKKIAVLEAIFSDRLSVITMTFLRLLVNKGREGHLAEIIVQFRELRDRREGMVPAEVVSAVDLTGAQERQLQRELELFTKKQIRLSRRVDAAIGAGLLVRLGDTVLDGTLRRQLERLRERMVEGAASSA
jgi:F-type H+-transporting ATPase subunit delta